MVLSWLESIYLNTHSNRLCLGFSEGCHTSPIQEKSTIGLQLNSRYKQRRGTDGQIAVSKMAALEEEQVMVVGIDDSQHSTYALEWTFDHFFTLPPGSNSPFKVVVVHAKPSATSVVSLAGPGTYLFSTLLILFISSALSSSLSSSIAVCSLCVFYSFLFVFRDC